MAVNGVVDPPPRGETTEQDLADSARFFGHELRGTTRYVPDIAALKAAPAHVVVGVVAAVVTAGVVGTLAVYVIAYCGCVG